MEIDLKELEPCRLMVTYQADAEQILNKRGEVLNHFRKAPVPGFRAGKATVEAIKRHYKSQIEESLKRALAEDAYHNTLFEKKLKPHGAPRITTALLENGKFTCEFEMFTKPDFTLASFKDLEIPKPLVSSSILELTEKMLQELRIRHGETQPYGEDDFIQLRDNVILNYEGSIDGVKVDNLSAEGEMLSVGYSQLQEFDNNLLGLRLGEDREFDLVVPETGLPTFAGKTVHFKVTLVMGSRVTPCPLNDELAVKMGKENFEKLREFVQGTAAARCQESERQELIQAISHRLIQDNVFTVPNWIVLSEAQYLAHKSHMKWEDILDLDKEKFMEMAEKNTRLTLILDKIREDEPEAQLSDEEVFNAIKQNIVNSKNQTPVDDVIKEMNKTGYLQILFSRMKDEYTLDFIVKSIKITE